MKRYRRGERIRNCFGCKWCIPIIDSAGTKFYICIDVNSSAYLREIGVCGSCDLEPIEEEAK